MVLGETVVSTAEDGLRRMRGGDSALHINEGILRAAFKLNPDLHQEVSVISRYPMLWQSVIFPKDSPLVPIFERATTLLREGGAIKRLQFDWEGRNLPTKSDSDVTV